MIGSMNAYAIIQRMNRWMGIQKRMGFTIVELLIVIVVIGILAGITIIAYNGIQDRAKVAAMTADLTNAAKALETTKIQSSPEVYPALLSTAKVDINNSSYYVSSTDNSYCLSQSNGQKKYHVTSRSPQPVEGECGESSLLAWWQLNGNANDSKGSFNGTIINAAAAVGQGGAASTAYQFNRTDTEINLPIPSTSTTNMTVTAWIYVQSGTVGAIFHVGNNGGGYSLGVGDGYNNLSRKITGLFSGKRWITTSTVVTDGWHLLGMSLSANSTPSFYYDGELVLGAFAGTPPSAPTNVVVLGRNTGDEGTAVDKRFDGRIDDVRFYNSVLSVAEHKGMFSAGAK